MKKLGKKYMKYKENKHFYKAIKLYLNKWKYVYLIYITL